MKNPLFSLALLFSILFAASVSADIVHDESVDGDLSGDFAVPTPLTFATGANTILGDIGANGNTGSTNGLDADYFTVVVVAGQELNSIFVDSRTGPGFQSFFGFTEGSEFTGQGNGDIDGNVLFNDGSGEVINALAGGPLGPGTYSFWIQETDGSGVVDYSFTFGVTNAVPEPSTLVFGLIAGCGLAIRRRR